MRMRRLLSLATALGLAATLTVPPGALAHEMVETVERFNGNYLMVDVGTTGPVGEVRLDVYHGKIGRTKGATLVTASAYSYDWESIPGTPDCRVEWTTWIGQSGDSPSDDVEFFSPYAGALQVALETHGRTLLYEGVVSDTGTWCEYDPNAPTLVTDLGEANLTASATWDSVVVLKGKKLITVRTSVTFDALTFDDKPVIPDGEQNACSLARRMPIPVYEFIG